MKTNKAYNAEIAKRYNLPATLTGNEIAAASHGAFANHRFTLPSTGEHITGISHLMIQLREGDKVRNFLKRENPEAFAQIMESRFEVTPEVDPTW